MSNEVTVTLTREQASIVIEAVSALCERHQDEARTAKWGRESAEKKVSALAAEVARLKAKKNGKEGK